MSSDDTKRFDNPEENQLDTNETRQLVAPDDGSTKVLSITESPIPKRLRVVMPDQSELVFDNISPHLTIGRKSLVNTRQIDIDMEPFDKGIFGVSRVHALILADQRRGLLIKDMQSTNGTFLNGSKLKALDERSLVSGDSIKCGNLKIQVFF